MKRILPSRPAGQSFREATATVIRVHPEPFIPDYDRSAIDLALVEFEQAMHARDEQDIEMVRAWLDMLGTARFWLIGLKPKRRTKGTFSDFALAAAMLHGDSPFGIQYRWPDGLTLVYYHGHIYKRDGNTMRLLGGE